MLIQQTGEQVRQIVSPEQFAAQRLDGVLHAFEDGSKIVFRVVQKSEEQFHRTISRAAPQPCHRGVEKIGEFISKVKDKNSNVKLMGFGHRVYKNYDPRAKLMRETCHEVLGELGLHDDPLFKLALELEKIALEDEYFVSRKLYPNVDFYSGIVQKAMGIPVSLFTGIFAMARTIGWIAQWNEMIGDPEQKIGRPRQLYIGEPRRDVRSMALRT